MFGFEELLRHPLTLSLVTALLMLFPFMRIYRRVGLNGLWAFGLFASLVVPFLGLLLALLPLLMKPWPHFPAPPATPKPQKTAL